MTIDSDIATVIVGAAVVVATAWGSYVSVRSAATGPAWALAHLGRARPVVLGFLVVAVVVAVAVAPVWVGLGMGYVAAAVLFLIAVLRRSLLRLEEYGGFEGLAPDRRWAIVTRARRLLVLVGVGLGVIGGSGTAIGAGPVAWVTIALGATLVVTAALLAGTQEA